MKPRDCSRLDPAVTATSPPVCVWIGVSQKQVTEEQQDTTDTSLPNTDWAAQWWFQDRRLTRIWTVSSPSPASLASMVNSTGKLAGTPDAFRPGPLARTLLASWAGNVLILKGLTRQLERLNLNLKDQNCLVHTSLQYQPPGHFLVGILYAHRIWAIVGRSIVDRVSAITIICDVEWLSYTWRQTRAQGKATMRWYQVIKANGRVSWQYY